MIKVGDRVRFDFGGIKEEADVVEDQGGRGPKGAKVIRVRWQVGEGGPPAELELLEDEVTVIERRPRIPTMSESLAVWQTYAAERTGDPDVLIIISSSGWRVVISDGRNSGRFVEDLDAAIDAAIDAPCPPRRTVP